MLYPLASCDVSVAALYDAHMFFEAKDSSAQTKLRRCFAAPIVNLVCLVYEYGGALSRVVECRCDAFSSV